MDEVTIKFSPRHFEESKKIWDFVNNYFGHSFPYPDVVFYLLNRKSWNALTSISGHKPHNTLEKERMKNHPEIPETETDACIIYREDNQEKWKKYSEDELVKLLAEHQFTIIIKKGANTNRGKMFTKKAGFSVKDYYHFHILHEFIHVLERLTKKQLLIEDIQDWKMFYHYKGYNGELVKSPII